MLKRLWKDIPDNKVHGANVGPTWVLSAPDGPHLGPMNIAIRDVVSERQCSIALTTLRHVMPAHVILLIEATSILDRGAF